MNAPYVNLINISKESCLLIKTLICFACFPQIRVDCPVMQKRRFALYKQEEILGNTSCCVGC
jgi:hypothetical protein